MSKLFDYQNNKAICALPFLHEHYDLEGRQRSCCHAKPFEGNRNIDAVRDEMKQGIQPVECSACYDQENNNQTSARVFESVKFNKRHNFTTFEECETISIDIRNDATCNLKCKYCGPYASTLWQKELGQVEKQIPKNDLNKYNKTKLKYVYFAGGEPTLNKDVLVFLKELILVNPDCDITINSNLNRLSDEWKEFIKQAKRISFVMSCEATGILGTYLRYPLDWNNFEKNVQFVTEHASYSSFHLVANCLNLHKIDSTTKWMNNYADVSIKLLTDPKYFQLTAIPYDARQTYIDAITGALGIKINPYMAYRNKRHLRQCINILQSQNYDLALHQSLLENIKKQDSYRHISLEKADAFLHNWVYNINT